MAGSWSMLVSRGLDRSSGAELAHTMYLCTTLIYLQYTQNHVLGWAWSRDSRHGKLQWARGEIVVLFYPKHG